MVVPNVGHEGLESKNKINLMKNDQIEAKNVVWCRKGCNYDKNMDNGNRY